VTTPPARRDPDRLGFLDGRLPRWCERRVVTVAPGQSRPYDEVEWRDAIVVVERGEIELEGSSGERHGFRGGDVLWLTGLPLRALHNPSRREPAVLVAVSKQAGPRRRSRRQL